MAQIVYRGILSSMHSWAVTGTELCLALHRLGYDIGVQSTNGDRDINETIKGLIDRSSARAIIGLGYTIPRNLKTINAERRVCIYNYETTVMPPGWAKEMSQYADLILPSSEFAKNIFIQNGVQRSKIAVLHHGVDIRRYNPSVPPLALNSNKFKFLCVAEPHARKGLDILLQAFAEEFASTEDVMLVIKSRIAGPRRAHYEIDIRELITSFHRRYSMPEVKLLTDRFDSLAPLYNACDCFVLPTRSECFCLPALEAMACKLPVIITGYGGQTDFATKANSFLITYKIASAPKSMQYWHYDARAKVCEPDVEHLRILMRYVYKNREEAQKKAELAYDQVIPAYTWDGVGAQLIDLIKQQNWGKNYALKRSLDGTQIENTVTFEEARTRSHGRAVVERRERLQKIEQEIVSKQAEAERLRLQLSESDNDTHYKQLKSSFGGKVTIIVLNYNTKEAVKACIESVKQCTTNIPYELIVIDNGSADGSVEYLKRCEGIRLILNATNVGVSKGWNQGIEVSDQQSDIVVLNSDIVVTENWLSKLSETAYQDPTIGLVGCRIKGQKNHSGNLLHTGALIRNNGMGEENEWGIPLKDYGQYQISKRVQIVVGACMYLKRELLKVIGRFDEDFSPAYFEDSDMCLRTTQAGYKVYYCGAVTLLHEHSATSRANNINVAGLLETNRKKFTAKWSSFLDKKDCVVELKGPIYGTSGYAEACRNLAIGLWENNVGVAVKPLTSHPSEQHPKHNNVNIIVQEAISSPASYDNCIVFYLADFFIHHLKGKQKRIGYTMLEVDGVPANWIQYCNSYLTELWVPSTFNQFTFKKSGIRIPIRVVPLGVDTDRFNPHVLPLLPKSNRYTFLCVCEMGERKNVHLLMRAFQAEFNKSEPVQLILKISNNDPTMNVERELKQYDLRNVILLTQEYNTHQMPSLFRSADCFVMPSSGEGWGLPYAEAMACGLPTIGTAWSANTDFMNNDNSYLIRVERIVPAIARCPLYAGFNWALPDVEHMRKLLRHVYENQEEAKAKGMRASKFILEKYSLAKTAEIAKNYLIS